MVTYKAVLREQWESCVITGNRIWICLGLTRHKEASTKAVRDRFAIHTITVWVLVIQEELTGLRSP